AQMRSKLSRLTFLASVSLLFIGAEAYPITPIQVQMTNPSDAVEKASSRWDSLMRMRSRERARQHRGESTANRLAPARSASQRSMRRLAKSRDRAHDAWRTVPSSAA